MEKNLLNSNIYCTCSHNMVNFYPLTAEICWRVLGTRANYNGVRVLAALLHGTLVLGVSQTAALNRRRHLYSAGRPSRWAFGHISSVIFVFMNPKSESKHAQHGCRCSHPHTSHVSDLSSKVTCGVAGTTCTVLHLAGRSQFCWANM